MLEKLLEESPDAQELIAYGDEIIAKKNNYNSGKSKQ
jgi:hypothetical protein